MDSSKQRAARLRLAEGFFETLRLDARSSEHEIRNALSRCYYSFFHLSQVVLGRYRGHELVAQEIGNSDDSFGQFVATLQALRIEADYIPDVVQRIYGGDLAAYRFRAGQVLAMAAANFEGMLKLARRKFKKKKA